MLCVHLLNDSLGLLAICCTFLVGAALIDITDEVDFQFPESDDQRFKRTRRFAIRFQNFVHGNNELIPPLWLGITFLPVMLIHGSDLSESGPSVVHDGEG